MLQIDSLLRAIDTIIRIHGLAVHNTNIKLKYSNNIKYCKTVFELMLLLWMVCKKVSVYIKYMNYEVIDWLMIPIDDLLYHYCDTFEYLMRRGLDIKINFFFKRNSLCSSRWIKKKICPSPSPRGESCNMAVIL